MFANSIAAKQVPCMLSVLGVMLIVGCFGYLTVHITTFLVPDTPSVVRQLFTSSEVYRRSCSWCGYLREARANPQRIGAAPYRVMLWTLITRGISYAATIVRS